MKREQFRNKIILVIGGSTRMGLSIIRSVLKEDATVIVPAKSVKEIEHINANAGTGGYGNLITELKPFYNNDGIESYRSIVKKFGKVDLALGIVNGLQFSGFNNEIPINEWLEITQNDIPAFFLSPKVILHMVKEQKRGTFNRVQNIDMFDEIDFSGLSKIVFNAKIEMSTTLGTKTNGNLAPFYHLFIDGLFKQSLPDSKVNSSNTNLVGYGMLKMYNMYSTAPNQKEDISRPNRQKINRQII